MEIAQRTENYTQKEYEQKLFSIIDLWVDTKKNHLLADIYWRKKKTDKETGGEKLI